MSASAAASRGGIPSTPPSKPSVSVLLDDLRAEQNELESVVTSLSDAQWRLPSTPGWTVRDQIAHLAFFDQAATRSIVDPAAFAAQRREALLDIAAYEQSHLRVPPDDGPGALAAWRQAARHFRSVVERADPAARLSWFGPDMGLLSMISARLMETWAHGQDVVDALGLAREPSVRMRHVAGLAVRARAQGYAVRDLPAPDAPVRVDLVAPDGGAWEFGPEEAEARIRGSAEDFCLVLARRRHVDDTTLVTEGALAREWMEIGQAYAGPPGTGPARRAERGGSR